MIQSKSAEPEAADWRLDVNAVRFPLNTEINTTKTDSGEKAAVKNAAMWMIAQALQFSTSVKSSHVTFIYIVLYAIDSQIKQLYNIKH